MKTNFNSYVPRTYSWGTSLSREKYKLRANWNYRGRAGRAQHRAARRD